jgi:hypothetical protein
MDVIEQKQPPPGQGQPPPPPGKPVLVPPITELKLMRRLQTDLNRKIETFKQTNPGISEGEVDDNQRRRLERLSHQQGRIQKTLDELIQKIFGGGDEGH